jgi:hypothetical protein
MTIYACVVNSKVPEVQFIGVLSYSVPQALSTNWYAILDISSSATADSPINDKGVSYDFKNNSWVNNEGVSGTVNEATVASSGQLSYPTATTDFYVWAYGSYGGATLTPINDHPNITQLATCASNTSTGYSTIQGSTTVSTGSGTTSHGVTATGSATHAINTTTNKKPTPRGIDRLYRDFLNLF